jgi:hypothetical protein
MATKFLEFINPGYSSLYVRDLPYVAGSGDVAGTNPLDPNDARPLIDGEWLQLSSTGKSFTRGGNNAMAAPLTPDGEGTVPAFPFFLEKGRYDAQHSKLCHVVMGPHGFEFRTKACVSAGLSVNSKVSVWDYEGLGGGIVRRVLAVWAAGYCIGRVTRVFGTDDISVHFTPGGA